MVPVMCRVKSDNGAGSNGDCLRACIASLLECDAEAVPHFQGDTTDGNEGARRLAEFLSGFGYGMFYTFFDGSLSVDDLRTFQGLHNPTVHYLLYGRTASGELHVVLCKGSDVAHDPAWVRSPIAEPSVKTVDGQSMWMVGVVCVA